MRAFLKSYFAFTELINVQLYGHFKGNIFNIFVNSSTDLLKRKKMRPLHYCDNSLDLLRGAAPDYSDGRTERFLFIALRSFIDSASAGRTLKTLQSEVAH